MRELLTTYRYPFGCLVIATAAFFGFLIAGALKDPMLFVRGGSIVVLFSAAAEYGLLQVQNHVTNSRINGVGSWGGPILSNFDIPPPFPRLRVTAHIYVIVGTFIWGFGDYFLIK